jgi:hypothetical protein
LFVTVAGTGGDIAITLRDDDEETPWTTATKSTMREA